MMQLGTILETRVVVRRSADLSPGGYLPDDDPDRDIHATISQGDGEASGGLPAGGGVVGDSADQVVPRPRTLADCPQSGPCPYVGCRYHLFLEVNPATGQIRYTWPGLEPDEIPETCAMRRANAGPMTLEAVGRTLGITRERTRQIQNMAVAHLAERWPKDER